MNDLIELPYFMLSRPLRARGLKLRPHIRLVERPGVAPLAGAWIETILNHVFLPEEREVAPLAGAWIETRTAPWRW